MLGGRIDLLTGGNVTREERRRETEKLLETRQGTKLKDDQKVLKGKG